MSAELATWQQLAKQHDLPVPGAGQAVHEAIIELAVALLERLGPTLEAAARTARTQPDLDQGMVEQLPPESLADATVQGGWRHDLKAERTVAEQLAQPRCARCQHARGAHVDQDGGACWSDGCYCWQYVPAGADPDLDLEPWARVGYRLIAALHAAGVALPPSPIDPSLAGHPVVSRDAIERAVRLCQSLASRSTPNAAMALERLAPWLKEGIE